MVVSQRGRCVAARPDHHGRTVRAGAARRIKVADVTGIDAVNRMQAGQTVYYNLVATCRDGKKVTIGKRVPGHHLALAVIAQIERALGKEPSDADA